MPKLVQKMVFTIATWCRQRKRDEEFYGHLDLWVYMDINVDGWRYTAC